MNQLPLLVLSFVLVSLSFIGSANAFMLDMWWGFLGPAMFGFGLIVFIILAVFWLWALIDSLGRDFKIPMDKLVWIVVIIFTFIIGAIIYYFLVKSKEAQPLVKRLEKGVKRIEKRAVGRR